MRQYQEMTADWLRACFPPEAATDNEERCDRFIEEALELVQAGGYRAERAHELVDYVFTRPMGDTAQELGGVMVTLAALSNAFGLDIETEAHREMRRVRDPATMEKIRAKQAAKPKGSALPIVRPDDGLSDADRLTAGLARLMVGFKPIDVLGAFAAVMGNLIVHHSRNETRALGEVAGYFANVEDQVKAHFSSLNARPIVAPVPIPTMVRPEVAAFAALMEQRLRENDHKPGWQDDHPQGLSDLCTIKAGKLADCVGRLLDDGVRNLDANRNAVPITAADVANFAMMTADVVMAGGLRSLQSEGEAA